MAKPPVDEEAHFRIDDIERKLQDVPSSEHIASIVGGAVGVMLEQVKRELAQMVAGNRQDVKADRELIDAVRELIECMKAPKARTITAHMPSGPVRITTEHAQ